MYKAESVLHFRVLSFHVTLLSHLIGSSFVLEVYGAPSFIFGTRCLMPNAREVAMKSARLNFF